MTIVVEAPAVEEDPDPVDEEEEEAGKGEAVAVARGSDMYVVVGTGEYERRVQENMSAEYQKISSEEYQRGERKIREDANVCAQEGE